MGATGSAILADCGNGGGDSALGKYDSRRLRLVFTLLREFLLLKKLGGDFIENPEKVLLLAPLCPIVADVYPPPRAPL